MKRKKNLKKWPLLLALAVILTLLPRGVGRAAEPRQSDLYSYWLEGDDGIFQLYVERHQPGDAPLHAGSIALAIDSGKGSIAEFRPAVGWTVMSIPYPHGDGDYPPVEPGTVEGESRISFYWYLTEGGSAADTVRDNRQLLGTLVIRGGTTEAGDITLLPWTETEDGGRMLADGQRELMAGTWRIDGSDPERGYYQGYYTVPDPESGQPGIRSVDIDAGWLGFTIGAYAPGKGAELRIEQLADNGSGYEPVRTDTITFSPQSPGYFRDQVRFSTAGFEGTYRLTLLKPAHVPLVLEGLVFQNGFCQNLDLPLYVELPCGDIVENNSTGEGRGDGFVTLADRTELYYWLGYEAGDKDGAWYADLNGDGVVSQADLDIIMLAENYNHETVRIVKEGGTGT